jgi:hypothetical protein
MQRYIITTLSQEKAAAALARSYNILLSPVRLRSILATLSQRSDVGTASKFDLHRIINTLIFESYLGEARIKAMLVDKFFSDRVVAAFEIRANRSRADFLTVNGITCSYEIKSELDNLMKLKKQADDFSRLFEYNYVVVDKKHISKATEILPGNYGIYEVTFNGIKLKKKAQKNNQTDAASQLKLFTKKELETYFDSYRSLEHALNSFSPGEINAIFKKMLKHRYEDRWNFVLNHKKEILPLDYQFFFKNNILPSIIYEQPTSPLR